MKTIINILSILIISLFFCFQQSGKKKTGAELDGLKGTVKQVKQECYNAIDSSYEIIKSSKSDINNNLTRYDENGNKINYCQYDSTGRLLYRHTYKYDGDGNQIEEAWYNPDSTLYLKSTFKYDDNGNQIEENDRRPNGSLRYRSTSTYDSKGNKIKENQYNPDSTISYKTTFKYDDVGKKIKESEYSADGKLVSETSYSYQERDDHGNWIKATAFSDNLPSLILLREITYYE